MYVVGIYWCLVFQHFVLVQLQWKPMIFTLNFSFLSKSKDEGFNCVSTVIKSFWWAWITLNRNSL